MRVILLTCFALLAACSTPYAQGKAHLHLEKYYQERWCNEHHGVMKYRLPDKTRVDCLTDEYAIEFDFASKWAESIGQALYYAEMTGKRPGVVLIIEYSGDERFKKRLERVTDRHGITVWTTAPDK